MFAKLIVMVILSERAIVLSRRYIGEDDVLVCLLGKQSGIFWSVAKHGRKSLKRFLNLLEPPSILDVYLRKIFFGSKIILEKVDVIETFPKIKSDIVRIFSSWFVLEFCRAFWASPDSFQVAERNLYLIENFEKGNIMDILLKFSAEFLDCEGYGRMTIKSKLDLIKVCQDLYGTELKFFGLLDRVEELNNPTYT